MQEPPWPVRNDGGGRAVTLTYFVPGFQTIRAPAGAMRKGHAKMPRLCIFLA